MTPQIITVAAAIAPWQSATQVPWRRAHRTRQPRAITLAKLVAHEVDHLFGVLCKDRMRRFESIPVIEHRGAGGQQWQY